MAILKAEFRGENGRLFLLALKYGVLMFLTLGFYRFWARTRLRRWYWSSVHIGGSPLEYSGTALEKVTGFVFALLIIVALLTVSNLFGLWAAVRMLPDNPEALNVAPFSFVLLLLPLFFFARYRARKYMLSRTSWRGIRFSMARGAWGYAALATIYTVLTVATLGLFLPFRTFLLEKYLTNRTWFGNARFTQHGSPWKLFGPALPLLGTIWGAMALAFFSFSSGLIRFVEVPMPDGGSQSVPNPADGGFIVYYVILLSVPVAALFAVYYRVASVRVLHALKELGEGIEFDIWPRTRTVISIFYWGRVKTNIATTFVISALSGLVLSVIWLLGFVGASDLQEFGVAGLLAMGIVGWYLFYRPLFFVFKQTFFIFPLTKHVVESVELHNPELLGHISPRRVSDRDDAGGFAEALDAGAAF